MMARVCADVCIVQLNWQLNAFLIEQENQFSAEKLKRIKGNLLEHGIEGSNVGNFSSTQKTFPTQN